MRRARRSRRLLLAAAVTTGIVVPIVGPSPAHAANEDAAYCPTLDPVTATPNVTGSVTYNPGVTLSPTPNTFSMSVSCTAHGPGDDAGTYSLTLNSGIHLDSCVASGVPSGTGSLGGTGPHGVITGTFGFFKGGTGYTITGTYASGAHAHRFWLVVFIENPTPSPCFYNAADISLGQLLVLDDPPVPDPTTQASIFLVGGGAISPGIPPATMPTTTVTNIYTFAASALQGEFNGVPGQCLPNVSVTATDSFASGVGSGTASCVGTDANGGTINISCGLTFTRAGGVVVDGTCTGTSAGVLRASFAFVPQSPSPTTWTTSYGVIGYVAIV